MKTNAKMYNSDKFSSSPKKSKIWKFIFKNSYPVLLTQNNQQVKFQYSYAILKKRGGEKNKQ